MHSSEELSILDIHVYKYGKVIRNIQSSETFTSYNGANTPIFDVFSIC